MPTSDELEVGVEVPPWLLEAEGVTVAACTLLVVVTVSVNEEEACWDCVVITVRPPLMVGDAATVCVTLEAMLARCVMLGVPLDDPERIWDVLLA